MNQEDIDFRSEAELLLSIGRINRYMASYLLDQIRTGGMNEALWQEGINDAELASKLGVDSPEEFKIFFYIDHFAPDLAKDVLGVRLEKDELSDLVAYMFSIRNEVSFNNLLSFRAAVLKWVESKNLKDKTAHPNIGGSASYIRKPAMDQWYELALDIKKAVLAGAQHLDAIKQAASELKVPERYNFLTWYNFYAKNEDRKYNVNDEIKALNREIGSRSMISNASYADDGLNYFIPKMTRDIFSITPQSAEIKNEKVLEKELPPAADFFEANKKDEQRALDFEAGRNKLMSRTFAIDKLLEKYRKVLSDEEMGGLEDTLNELRKKVRKLKFAESFKDALIKTANIFLKRNFEEGADALFALAEDPMAGPDISVEPASSKDSELQDVVRQLDALSAQLKNREIIRALAKVDLELHDKKMAVFFPEITEAQARLIEAFAYASNKIEEVLPKLKGSLMSEQVKETVFEAPISSDKQQVASEVKELAAPLGLKHRKEVLEPPALEVESPEVANKGPFKI